VTRAGDLIDRRGVITGGETPAAAGLLERRRLLAELSASLEATD
jgi:chromosome segregation ATPase